MHNHFIKFLSHLVDLLWVWGMLSIFILIVPFILAIVWAFKNKRDILKSLKFTFTTVIFDSMITVGTLLFISSLLFHQTHLVLLAIGLLSFSTFWGVVHAVILAQDDARKASTVHCIIYSTLIALFLALVLPFGFIGM